MVRLAMRASRYHIYDNRNYTGILGKFLHPNQNLKHTTKQGSRVSWLAQTGFAAFGKGVQLISGSPYDETEQLSRLIISSETSLGQLTNSNALLSVIRQI